MEKTLPEVEEKYHVFYSSYFASSFIKNTSDSTNNTFLNYLFYSDKHALKLLEEKTDILDLRIRKESRSLEQVMRSTKKSDTKYGRIPAIQPISKKDMKNVAFRFDIRFHPILKILRMHSVLFFFYKTERSGISHNLRKNKNGLQGKIRKNSLYSSIIKTIM